MMNETCNRRQILQAVAVEYKPQMQRSVDILLERIPKAGGHVSRDILQQLIETSFQAGVMAARDRLCVPRNN